MSINGFIFERLLRLVGDAVALEQAGVRVVQILCAVIGPVTVNAYFKISWMPSVND